MSAPIADQKLLPIQKMVFDQTMPGVPVNSYEPHARTERKVFEDGMVLINDISYESKYPNGFFDLWIPAGKEIRRPTAVYIHGGGFLFGDKAQGDPLAKDAPTISAFLREIAAHGFNVVSMNYAFAPEHRFPVAVLQLNELLLFLKEHGDEYGLDTCNFVIGGGSAGADMSAIYGLALTDEEYAKKLGLVLAVAKEDVKALVIDEAALDLDSMAPDLRMLLGSWLDSDDLPSSVNADLADITKRVNGEYPASYLISSNLETGFAGFGRKLEKVLKEKGVCCEHYYVSQDIDKLEHGFSLRYASNECAAECVRNMFEFICQRV